MKRYIFRYKGIGEAPVEDLCSITNDRNIHVVDATKKMMLVEASQLTIDQAMNNLSGDWAVSSEKTISLPDTRAKLKSW